MPNLLIATGIFHPESGGPATYLYHLLPHLQAAGYTVHVLTYGDPDPEQDAAYPYPVTRIPRTHFALRTFGYWWQANALLRWADVVYIHSALVPLPPSRTPRVIKIVGDPAWERAVQRGWVHPLTDIDAFQFMRTGNPLVYFYRRTRRRAVQRSQYTVVPSAYLKKLVMKWRVPSVRVQVIYNALPTDDPAATLSQAEARAQLGLPPDQPLLLTVARLTVWKGVNDFIVAMKSLPDLHYIVIGDGPFREQLEPFAVQQGVGDRVTFLGRVPREQVAVYMRAADYVGLYSGYEGLSHVLLESLRAGTPVIASRKGGNPEVVRHEVNGLLVCFDDVPALEAALHKAYTPGQREVFAANTHVDIETFAYPRMVEETLAVLDSALRAGT
jgi:glycosyltransferase involved in cell wall biosynthesis